MHSISQCESSESVGKVMYGSIFDNKINNFKNLRFWIKKMILILWNEINNGKYVNLYKICL